MSNLIKLSFQFSEEREKSKNKQISFLDHLKQNTTPKFGVWDDWYKMYLKDFVYNSDTPNCYNNDSFFNWLWKNYNKIDEKKFEGLFVL